MGRKILIVDDEKSIVTLLKYSVEQAGFKTDIAYTGTDALEKATNHAFDLIILDIMLEGLEGTEVCTKLRQKNIETPILMLTAKDSEFDKVLGLELGADDYLTKPFSPKEVVARIKAILRRTNKKDVGEKVIPISDLTIFPERYEALMGEKALQFTRKEFELLLYLAEHKGRVLSRSQLLMAVWDYDFEGDTRIVDVHISNLRDKLEPKTKRSSYIQTVHGLGYKLIGS